MLLVATVKIKNYPGLHTRPATELVKLLQFFKSRVFLTFDEKTVNAKSILGLLLLAMPKNSNVKLEVRGSDAELVMKRLIEAFDEGFGEF